MLCTYFHVICNIVYSMLCRWFLSIDSNKVKGRRYNLPCTTDIIFLYNLVYPRDVVQPPVFVTAALERNKKKLALSSLSPGQVAARRSRQYKTLLCVLSTRWNVRPTLLIWIWILAFCLCNPLFSCSISWNWSSHWHWWFPCAVACLASRDIDGQVTAWKFRCPFSPYSVSPRVLDKALIEKPMFVQEGSFCTSNLSSGTSLQQDFVIWKVGWKHFMMNILAAVHFA